MTFEARFRGRCAADCGRPIEPGDPVVYVDDELVHVGCEERGLNLAQLDSREVVCTACFLVRPCPCDDEGHAA